MGPKADHCGTPQMTLFTKEVELNSDTYINIQKRE